MRTSGFVALIFTIVLVVSAASAHPPKDVKIEFDQGSKMLMVTAYHDTKDATKHFVGVIEVDLNGEKVIEQKFKSQIGTDAQKAHYWVNDAKIGDEISVTATCNIAGKKKMSLKIEKKAEGEQPATHH